ncbi:(E2-independent) E3 ubiquitin-conjugating enzyme FATS [Pipistrellus kuhlii]|uniref:Fragile-site associated tumor suppressor n=1 Tax=Pipistrellus kuhlii TaxID=59472 RepID=A0A7J7VAD3_PIPKU|nr:(E2-independent) E3 ubiquitin-conjugating enzyme FATS [Pipistrellus kuhlii]KAF6322092.1 fragile-site associated tumor suppressor [Pipistrellus kuhlii]
MQRPGVPAGTRPPGAAARRAFQIRAFSTELKHHVMVMDFVKSSWFPSQRRAKVCLLRLYHGLKPAERSAGRCEEALASQNRKMISSLVISQLMDEHKPAEKGPAVPVPVPCAGAQPPPWPGRRALAPRSGVAISRAFALLPGQPGPPPPARVPAPAPKLTPEEERQPGGSPQRGFASITITARRVGPPARALVWGPGGSPLCTRCRAPDPQPRGPPALAGGADPGRHHGPPACTEPSGSSAGMRLESPEAHARLCDGHQCWGAGGDHRLSGHRQSGRGPLLFSSCVHLRVSRPCPTAPCSQDRSLSVPMEPSQPAGPQKHRSVLSLHLNCSSHRLTPEGAGGPASGGPMGSGLKQPLAEGPSLLGPHWAPALHPSVGQGQLGASTCPWRGPPPTGSTELAEAGTEQVTARKGSGDHGTPGHTGSHHTSSHASAHTNQLSIHIPGWSYRAGDYTCCDLVVQIKECETREATAAAPGPAPPPPPRPAPSEEPETPDQREDCSECRQAPASNTLTLQEALEARRPQFISRSQERLRRLELMAQQRRAQRQESPGPRPGPLPVRTSRRQFTVPHPLSDNLFKPKERCISEKEMHMRSKRIYNNLPEVRKKKEEQKKRVILQSNRLRAEVFKKQLLDQLLQRNAV